MDPRYQTANVQPRPSMPPANTSRPNNQQQQQQSNIQQSNQQQQQQQSSQQSNASQAASSAKNESAQISNVDQEKVFKHKSVFSFEYGARIASHVFLISF